MKAVVKQVEFPAGRRILVISDIHGNLPWFQALLAKAGFSREDILVLVGDLVEKGGTVWPRCGTSWSSPPPTQCTLCAATVTIWRWTLSMVTGSWAGISIASTSACGGESAYFADGRGGGDGSERPGDLPGLRMLLLGDSGPNWSSCGRCPPF